jgi:hypothetical protein
MEIRLGFFMQLLGQAMDGVQKSTGRITVLE